MAQTTSVIVNAEDRERLAAVLSNRNCPQKHVQRARIILLSAEQLPVAQIARQTGVSRPSVWRWQRRFGESGVEVLLREPSRKPGKIPLTQETVCQTACNTAPQSASKSDPSLACGTGSLTLVFAEVSGVGLGSGAG